MADEIKELQEQDIPFKLEDIDDVMLVMKVGDKRYTIAPKKEVEAENAKLIRKNLLLTALEYHDVVLPDLATLNKDRDSKA